jgi:2-(1,2-epoxy-1,2-dihydrophenyl)acetyl-CoA isomerase
MMESVLLQSREDGVLTLTMNRPDRLNALSQEMLQGLWDALSSAAADREIGAIVLAGAGRGFCAGGDVKAMAEAGGRRDSYDERVQGLRRRMEVARLLHEMAKPTIAMLRGPVAGAGLSLALACDLRIASETARLTTAFAKVALSGDFGGSYFLTQLVRQRQGARALLHLAHSRGGGSFVAGPRHPCCRRWRARNRDPRLGALARAGAAGHARLHQAEHEPRRTRDPC